MFRSTGYDYIIVYMLPPHPPKQTYDFMFKRTNP